MSANSRWQWQMSVTVLHGPSFGHKIELETNSPRWAAPHVKGIGSWRGMGVPEPVYNEARSLVIATFDEHLLTRYGIQGELPTQWAGEVGPF